MKHFSTTGISVHEQLQPGLRFCFLRNNSCVLRIANRMLETRLYNLFTFEDQNQPIYTEGSIDKNQFIHDGVLDVRKQK